MQLVIPLSKNGESLTRQLYSGLRAAILEGKLGPGERLPSTRDFAEQLGVSRTIVLLAFEQLLAEGFVEGRKGSGTYVSAALGAMRPRSVGATAKLALSHFGAMAESAVAAMNSPRFTAKGVRYDFSYTRGAIEGFPLEAWQRILMRNARRATVRAHDYGPAGGSAALREAIAAHLRRSRAVACGAEQVIVVNGSQQALDLAARVLLERGQRVAIEDPHYQGAREVFRAWGAQLCPVPVDDNGIDIEKLPHKAKLAFVTPSHQFPTGAVLPLSRRVALLDWAKRENAVIIEDDYDGEFRYGGQPVESMQGLDTEGRVIYTGTFSRTVFPALRLGYLVAPKSLVAALTSAKWLCDRHTATLEQETLAEFISSGAYERHLARARRANAKRRSALLAAIEAQLGGRVRVTGESSGTHVVLWPRTRMKEDPIIAAAAQQSVGIYGTSQYYLGKSRRTGLMLGYARMREEEIREGIRRLARVLE